MRGLLCEGQLRLAIEEGGKREEEANHPSSNGASSNPGKAERVDKERWLVGINSSTTLRSSTMPTALRALHGNTVERRPAAKDSSLSRRPRCVEKHLHLPTYLPARKGRKDCARKQAAPEPCRKDGPDMIRSQIAENRDSNSRLRLSAVEPVQNRGTENAVRMARIHSQ